MAVSLGNAFAGEINIVCFGTSFTNGKGVFRSSAWPARLEADLKKEGLPVKVINEGVNGNTTVDLQTRLSKAVPENTSIVILEYAAGNDIRAGIPFEGTVINTENIIATLTARKLPVLLLIRASNAELLEKRSKQFDDIVAKYKIKALGIEQPESSLLSDRQHPTAEAHAKIAQSMIALVKTMIQNAAATP
jgi:acyl-CoA thioesterase-1